MATEKKTSSAPSDLSAEAEKKAKKQATKVAVPKKKDVPASAVFSKRNLVLKWWDGAEQFSANVLPGDPLPLDCPKDLSDELIKKGQAQIGALPEGYYPVVKEQGNQKKD